VPDEPRPRRSGGLLRLTTGGLVLVVLLAALAAYQFDLGPRWFGTNYPSPVSQPAEIPPPAGLELPRAAAAAVVAAPEVGGVVSSSAVRRAVARLAGNRKLGRRVAVDVTRLADGTNVYGQGPELVTPASLTKLLTATAALEALGPDHRFATTVVATARGRQLTLVGGGDPLLERRPVDSSTYPARADLDTLARATVKALADLGRTRIRLSYDASLFTGPSVSRDWEPSYVPDDVVSRIGPLWVDEGRERAGYAARSSDPAASAAAVFAAALERHGVQVVGRVHQQTADPDAKQLAVVESAPLAQIVAHVLEARDNEGAEVLGRQVALGTDLPGSFAGATTAIRTVLAELGVDLSGARLYDASGLSRDNRLDVDTLLQVIGVAASDDHPELRGVITGLPVAGFTGSLSYRFDVPPAGRLGAGLGAVRAKTGTLTGVHGLAGVVTTIDGEVLGFVAVADRVKKPDTDAARALLDKIAASLAACACAA
jgi:D-alanyl-D-alanine carboxypeptidase/D-alanyl-D-alanine-endopeptidase (penicillin-binding protein 4)